MQRPLFTRRDFIDRACCLAGTALPIALIGSGYPSGLKIQENRQTTRSYGNHQIGFQSYSLRHFVQTEDFIRQARKLNLPYVEIWGGHLPLSSTTKEISHFQDRLQQEGMTVNAFGVEAFTEEHEKNESVFQFAQKLGVGLLTANPSKAAFPSLERLVSQYDIKVGIHNHGPEDTRWRLPEWILEAIDSLDPRIGACADLGHYIRADVDPIKALEILGTRVLGVHLKDFNNQGNHAVLGHGQLDVEKTFETFSRLGFNGPISLEFEGAKKNPLPQMEQCLDAISQAISDHYS